MPIFMPNYWRNMPRFEYKWENSKKTKNSTNPVFTGFWKDLRTYERKDKSAFRVPRQNPYFCLKWLKIKDFWVWGWDLYPCCTPILYEYLERQDFVNGLPSIKKILDNCNRSYILVITELTTPLTFMRNPVRLFYPIKFYQNRYKKEVPKTRSLFYRFWERDIWK